METKFTECNWCNSNIKENHLVVVKYQKGLTITLCCNCFEKMYKFMPLGINILDKIDIDKEEIQLPWL